MSEGADDMDADQFSAMFGYTDGDLDRNGDKRISPEEGKAYIRCKVTDACS